MKKYLVIYYVIGIILLMSSAVFAECNCSFKEENFVGKFILTDPDCSYNKYHGEIILTADGKGKSREYVDNKLFELPYQNLEDKDGYVELKWSFDDNRKELIIDWTLNGKYDKLAYFKSCVKGDVNEFSIKGFSWEGSVNKLNFMRVNGEEPVNKVKEESFTGIFNITNSNPDYYGEIVLLSKGEGKIREFIKNKPVLSAEKTDKDGYLPLKWSYNEENMVFTFNGIYRGKVAGNTGSFTIDKFTEDNTSEILHFERVKAHR